MLVERYDMVRWISWRELRKIVKELEFDYLLLGGWASHIYINEGFMEMTKREYIGSRDIDFGIRSFDLKNWESFLKNLGYRQINFRFYKFFLLETGQKIDEKTANRYPMHELFKLYVDLILDKKIKSNITFFDDPLILLSFSRGFRVKREGIYLVIPEILLTMKINALEGRDPEKYLKDILDILFLIEFVDFDEDLLREIFSTYLKNRKIEIPEEIKYELRMLGFERRQVDFLLRNFRIFLEKREISVR